MRLIQIECKFALFAFNALFNSYSCWQALTMESHPIVFLLPILSLIHDFSIFVSSVYPYWCDGCYLVLLAGYVKCMLGFYIKNCSNRPGTLTEKQLFLNSSQVGDSEKTKTPTRLQVSTKNNGLLSDLILNLCNTSLIWAIFCHLAAFIKHKTQVHIF